MAWLVEHGADVNAATTNGTTALHDAAHGGHVAAMEWLVEQGGDVYAVATNGDTALHSQSQCRL